MNKQELLTAISNEGHGSTNLKTLMNRNKAVREAVNAKGMERVVKWLEQAESKETARLKKESDKVEARRWKMSYREYTELQEKAKRLLNDFDTGHSMGCYRQLFVNGMLFAENDQLGEYANSCKYSPTYGAVNISLNKTQLRQIERVQGVWTIKTGESTAKWLESFGLKHRYSVDMVKGYLVGQSHGETLEEALNRDAVKQAQLKRDRLKNAKFVGVKHIKQAGACEIGIKMFAERHGLNPEFGYNLGYLKSLEGNEFLNRL